MVRRLVSLSLYANKFCSKQVIKLESQVEILKELQKEQACVVVTMRIYVHSRCPPWPRVMMMNLNNDITVSNHHPDLGDHLKMQNRDMALQSVFPRAFDKSIKDIPMDPSGYPSIRFWTQSQWTSLGQPPNGEITARLRFLEDEGGVMITKVRLDEMRTFVSSAFSELQELADNSIFPKIWAKAKGTSARAVVAACHSELRRRFEEFTLCSGEWKARSFMVEWYPGWARNHLNSDLDDDDIEIIDAVPAKRPADSQQDAINVSYSLSLSYFYKLKMCYSAGGSNELVMRRGEGRGAAE